MHARTARLAAVAAATLALTLPALGSASADITVADAPPSNTVVTEADVARQAEDTPPTRSWVVYTRPATPGTAVFTDGPGTPPLGDGSLTMGTVSGSDKVQIFNFDHVGTKLADINALGYATYRTAGQAQQLAGLNMVIDFNGPAVSGGFSTLVFEPVYNPDQGAVANGVWQDWDAYNGGDAIWWSTRAINGVCAVGCYVTWDAIVAANPDATILGGYGINQGTGSPSLVDSVDALEFGTASKHVVYDFEFDADGDGEGDTAPPTSKDQCKNGGYQNFNNPSFDNQGECVSYVEHNN